MKVYIVFDYNGNEQKLLGVFKSEFDACEMREACPESWVEEHEVIE